MKKIYQYFISLIISLISINKFINYNIKKNKKNLIYKNEILVEYYPYHESILAQNIVAKILQKKFNANINFYKANNYWSLSKKIIFYLFKFSPFSKRGIYHSFGAKNFIYPDKIFGKPNLILENVLKKINKKNDILKIRINNTKVGDLVYDGYLRYNYIESIKINDNFKKYLLNFIKIFLFWENYLKNNKPKAVICTHQIYEEGILNRLCVKNKIECYQVSLNYVFKTDSKNKSFLDSWFNYKKEFKKFSYKKQKISILEAKKFLKLNSIMKSRKYGVNNKKVRILIAAHCIYDAPHAFGKFNFNDMGEWLNFLFKYSKNKDYEWIIKIHPNCYDCDIKIIKRLLKNYPQIKILPKEVNHNELVKNNITHVLSVYGTIGYEYSYMNIPVILASENNPYKSFNFLIKCKNKTDFKNKLDNLKKIKLNFNKNELYQYCYMRFLHNFNILYNYKKFLNYKKNNKNSALIYKFFMKNKKNKNQINIILDLERKILDNQGGNYFN